jgi:hypothetical protein
MPAQQRTIDAKRLPLPGMSRIESASRHYRPNRSAALKCNAVCTATKRSRAGSTINPFKYLIVLCTISLAIGSCSATALSPSVASPAHIEVAFSPDDEALRRTA